MALTELQIKQAKPKPEVKVFKLSDGGGLQLWVEAEGAIVSKRWRWAYRLDGKQKLLAIGVYPTVSLRDAREAREAAKKLRDAGIDPSQHKKQERLASAHARTNTFEAVAAEVLDKKRREGKAPATLKQIEWCHKKANQAFGPRPIASIKRTEVLAFLKEVEAKGRVHTASRLKEKMGEVFRFAMNTGRAEVDPTASLQGVLTAHKAVNFASITTEKPFGALLRAVDGYEGAPETRIALQILALTFVRPGVLRSAEWAHFDLEAKTWTIPAELMKMRRPHAVPLASQAMALLDELKGFTGRGRFLFPNVRTPTRCMSENTINAALRGLGYSKDQMTGHGFRSSAATMLNESGEWHPDAIERQLAHEEKNAVRRAYVRGEYWDERVRMMARWADKLDGMRQGGEVIQLRVSK
jgi:integrase